MILQSFEKIIPSQVNIGGVYNRKRINKLFRTWHKSSFRVQYNATRLKDNTK